jgi:hypothetical protein
VYSPTLCGLVALGYAVLLVNFRGSLGFGEDSIAALVSKIGEVDVADVRAAEALAVATGSVRGDCKVLYGEFFRGDGRQWVLMPRGLGQVDRTEDFLQRACRGILPTTIALLFCAIQVGVCSGWPLVLMVHGAVIDVSVMRFISDIPGESHPTLSFRLLCLPRSLFTHSHTITHTHTHTHTPSHTHLLLSVDWCYTESGLLFRPTLDATAEETAHMTMLSPSARVGKVKAPTMVMLGAKDLRCGAHRIRFFGAFSHHAFPNSVPPSQGHAWYRALLERGVPTKYADLHPRMCRGADQCGDGRRMVVYPEESHSLAGVEAEYDSFVRIAEWLQQYAPVGANRT